MKKTVKAEVDSLDIGGLIIEGEVEKTIEADHYYATHTHDQEIAEAYPEFKLISDIRVSDDNELEPSEIALAKDLIKRHFAEFEEILIENY